MPIPCKQGHQLIWTQPPLDLLLTCSCVFEVKGIITRCPSSRRASSSVRPLKLASGLKAETLRLRQAKSIPCIHPATVFANRHTLHTTLPRSLPTQFQKFRQTVNLGSGKLYETTGNFDEMEWWSPSVWRSISCSYWAWQQNANPVDVPENLHEYYIGVINAAAS